VENSKEGNKPYVSDGGGGEKQNLLLYLSKCYVILTQNHTNSKPSSGFEVTTCLQEGNVDNTTTTYKELIFKNIYVHFGNNLSYRGKTSMMQMLSTGYNYCGQMSVSPGTVVTQFLLFSIHLFIPRFCVMKIKLMSKNRQTSLNISSPYVREVHSFSTVLWST
jgi:hypothetical protein